MDDVGGCQSSLARLGLAWATKLPTYLCLAGGHHQHNAIQ